MNNESFEEFELDYDLTYSDCEFIIKKVLERFDAVITENIGDDIDTIYCDILIKPAFRICIHYHSMVGVVIMALTKDSESAAKEVADFINDLILKCGS